MRKRRIGVLSSILALLTIITSIGAFYYQDMPDSESLSAFARGQGRLINRHSQALAVVREKKENGNEAKREIFNGPAQEQYENRAYPNDHVDYTQVMGSQAAHRQLSQVAVAAQPASPTGAALDQQLGAQGSSGSSGGGGGGWKEVGPKTPVVPGPVTYTGRETTTSGRITALALDPKCSQNECRLYVGAAGGGVWSTTNAMAGRPKWKQLTEGLPSSAIGSLHIDPTDSSGKTIYVGTGEPSGSSDSEAGIGLYVSGQRGIYWFLVPGSVAVAKDRAIAAIQVDPTNKNHIWIGTAVARHGSSSVNGGRFTPPNAPKIGLYESTNGGNTFNLVFSVASDVVDPTTPNGSDFFRGGVSTIERAPDGTLYFSIMGYGLYRSKAGGGYEQVFASAGGGDVATSLGARTEFALAPNGNQLRIYVGDTDGGPADFYRVDNANVPANTLTSGGANIGWLKLSNAVKGTPGFGTYNFCGQQCSYDMFVASPKGRPNEVWLGGQMLYDEIFTANQPSNGRAVIRSLDAGVNITDMTNDARKPLPIGMHPDQHAIVFNPANPDIAFIGSDGGLIRTSGTYVDDSAECDNRGLSGVDLTQCKDWLKSVPSRINSLNDGLATLQFQSVSLNAQNPNDILGGTQDNGTWAYDPSNKSWFESVGGDGGQSGIDVGNPNIRMHSYFSAQHDVNFNGNDPLGWNWISDRLLLSGEGQSFYVPLINDPKVSGSWFVGLQHVWRTKDSGGDRAFLEQHCNEFFGDFTEICGDWEPLGGTVNPVTLVSSRNDAGDLAGTFWGLDKGGNAPAGNYVVAVERAPSDSKTLWAATRRGRLFISKNADAANAVDVSYTRIDTANTPTRFISGIAIDQKNPNRAYVSFSGYDAYAQAVGTAKGHVFDVTYNPNTGTATWKDISRNLGDQPITDVAYDTTTGIIYASTDYGVVQYHPRFGSGWVPTSWNLPTVAVYGLTINVTSTGRVLYAATHGRGIWKLSI